MEQSSIEWYAKQLARIGLTDEVIGHLTNEANQMHKQEIEDAYFDGGEDVPLTKQRCEEYYKKTYEKD